MFNLGQTVNADWVFNGNIILNDNKALKLGTTPKNQLLYDSTKVKSVLTDNLGNNLLSTDNNSLYLEKQPQLNDEAYFLKDIWSDPASDYEKFTDPSFELNDGSCTYSGGATRVNNSGQAHSGSYFAQCGSTSAYITIVLSVAVDLVKELGMWISQISGTTNFTVTVTYTDATTTVYNLTQNGSGLFSYLQNFLDVTQLTSGKTISSIKIQPTSLQYNYLNVDDLFCTTAKLKIGQSGVFY